MQTTYVIALDEESAAYLDRCANGDPNGFITGLLQKEAQKQDATGKPRKARELISDTPDASATAAS